MDVTHEHRAMWQIRPYLAFFFSRKALLFVWYLLTFSSSMDFMPVEHNHSSISGLPFRAPRLLDREPAVDWLKLFFR